MSHFTLRLLRDLIEPMLELLLTIHDDHSFALAQLAADDADEYAEDGHYGTDNDWDHQVSGAFLFFACSRCIISCNLFGIKWVGLNLIVSLVRTLICWVTSLLFIFFFLLKHFKLGVDVDITRVWNNW